MMGQQTGDQSQLFYLFNLERRIPAGHLLRRINPVVTQILGELRQKLAPFYSDIGRPSIDPELMIRMLIIGYCYSIRFAAVERRSLQVLAVVDRPIVNEADGDRDAGDGSSHALAEMQWGAALQRRIDGFAVDITHGGRRVVARISHARRSCASTSGWRMSQSTSAGPASIQFSIET